MDHTFETPCLKTSWNVKSLELCRVGEDMPVKGPTLVWDLFESLNALKHL